MKSIRLPLTGLLIFYILLGVFLWELAPFFPERMASHFGAGGVVDGWMSRTAFTIFLWKAGTLMAVLPCLIQCTRWIPDRWITRAGEEEIKQQRKNLDHALYWLVWMGCLMLLALGGIYYLTLLANQQNPPTLPSQGLGIWVSGLLLGVVIIFVNMIVPFIRNSGPSLGGGIGRRRCRSRFP